MNKSKQIITFILILFSLFSCSKEDDSKKDAETASINNKWIVENSTEYKSIEFDNNGNYIITKNKTNIASKLIDPQEIFVTGTYEILETDIFLLSDFGTVKFDDSDPNRIKFSIKFEGSNTFTYEMNVSKAAEFVSTPKTDILCNNTWKFIRNVPIKDTVSLINFSKAGTCYTNFNIENRGSDFTTELGKWRWQNSEETKIIITEITSPLWMVDKDGEVELEITKLNSTKLELKEIHNNQTYITVFDTLNVFRTKKALLSKKSFK